MGILAQIRKNFNSHQIQCNASIQNTRWSSLFLLTLNVSLRFLICPFSSSSSTDTLTNYVLNILDEIGWHINIWLVMSIFNHTPPWAIMVSYTWHRGIENISFKFFTHIYICRNKNFQQWNFYARRIKSVGIHSPIKEIFPLNQ